jgi:thioredoxin-related protein
MASDTWSDPAVAKAVSGYLPVQINIDNEPELAEHFGVEAIPVVAVVDGNGKVLGEQAGQMEPEEFLKWLEHVQTGA